MLLRHADESQHPFSLGQRRRAQHDGTIFPEWIILFDQRDLPAASPAFQSLFPHDGGVHRFGHFIMDQSFHPVTGREAGDSAGAMLMQPRHQVGCDADIDCAMTPAGKDIDAWLTVHSGATLNGC